MLSLFDRSGGRRREFLKIGGLALGGMALPPELRAWDSLSSGHLPLRDKSVVLLFLHGGPPQFETFDPKLSAPREIASTTGELATTIPGITFGGTFPRLATLADRLTIVRSFATGNGNHDIKPVVSPHSANASLGSLYSRIAGTNRPGTGMPTNVALFPRAVDPSTQEAQQAFGRFDATGAFSSRYAPFVPGAGGEQQANLQLQCEQTRLDDRRQLLTALDDLRRTFDQQAGASVLDPLRQQAFDAILGGAADAFDLSREDEATIRRYDTEPLVRPDQIDRKWRNYKNYVDNAKTLGKLMLLARRMCEPISSGTCTPTSTMSVWKKGCSISAGRSIMPCRRFSRTCATAVWRTAFCWWCAARWAGLRGSTPREAGTTGAVSPRC